MFGLIENKSGFGKTGTRISENTKIKGFVESTGMMRIDGKIKGGIHKACGVVIGNTGLIEGDVYSNGVKLHGKIKGNIFSESLLKMLDGSILIGNIRTVKLEVNKGAHFNGVCTMVDEKMDKKDQ